MQHSINFSWPNSKKCNQSASEFHYVQKLALLWETRSDENKWVKSSHWTGKTTDWWKVTESFVQSSQDHRGVLYKCHCVRGFRINCTVRTSTRAGMFVMKNDDTARQRQHYTPRATTKTQGWNRWQPPTTELCARRITLKKNFKKKLQALKSTPLFSVSSSLTPSLKRTA